MDFNVKTPSLALYLTPTSTGLSSQPKLWHRRHDSTRSAPPKLGYVPTALVDVLGRGSRTSTPSQQWLISCPPTRPGVHSQRADVKDVLIWTEAYRRSTAERHRLQVLEQVQRAVRHETLNTHEPESNTGLLLIVTTAPTEAVSKSNIDKWTQTEETLCDLPDRITDQKADTEVVPQQQHDPLATVGLRHTYPLTCEGNDCRVQDRQRASKADDAPVIKLDFNHRRKDLLVYNSSTDISNRQEDGETKPNANVNASVACLTPQTKCMHTDSNNKPKGVTYSVTQTSVETANSEDNGTATMNKKQVSLTREFSENFSKSSSCSLHHGQPSTPMFFTNLQHMEWKIATGQVDRKIYISKHKQELTRILSAVPVGELSRRELYNS